MGNAKPRKQPSRPPDEDEHPHRAHRDVQGLVEGVVGTGE